MILHEFFFVAKKKCNKNQNAEIQFGKKEKCKKKDICSGYLKKEIFLKTLQCKGFSALSRNWSLLAFTVVNVLYLLI